MLAYMTNNTTKNHNSTKKKGSVAAPHTRSRRLLQRCIFSEGGLSAAQVKSLPLHYFREKAIISVVGISTMTRVQTICGEIGQQLREKMGKIYTLSLRGWTVLSAVLSLHKRLENI